jgi:hypothetical protein
MKSFTTFLVLSLGAITRSLLADDLVAGSAKPKERMDQPVAAADLISKIPVIGELGIPLLQTATVRGTWHDPGPQAKDSKLIFRVTEINGQPTKAAIEFRSVRPIWESGESCGTVEGVKWDWKARTSSNVRAPLPKADETWEIIAFETGYIFGSSKEADEILQYVASPLLRRGLVTELKFLRMRLIE